MEEYIPEALAAVFQDKDPEAAWNKLVEELAAGRLSILETLKATTKILAPKGDHEGFVMHTRAYYMLMSDRRILLQLRSEIEAEIKKRDGPDKRDEIAEGVKAKDGERLFEKLGQINAKMYGDGPSLLAPGTFAECLAQYQRLVGHVETLWDDACRHYAEGRYPLCTFLSLLAIEEIGKLGRLWHDLLGWDQPQPAKKGNLGLLGRDHRKKHFMGVISGAVVNARLDRVLGKDRIKQLLVDVEKERIEPLRQACLYVDMEDGRIVLPEDRIDQATAKFYVVLVGELWAEILGHFPWEFERMIAKVMEFEISAGFDEAIVRQR